MFYTMRFNSVIISVYIYISKTLFDFHDLFVLKYPIKIVKFKNTEHVLFVNTKGQWTLAVLLWMQDDCWSNLTSSLLEKSRPKMKIELLPVIEVSGK